MALFVKELQIGDLVCYDGDTDYECPVKVDGISVDDISIEGDGFLGGAESVVVPIPLTEEILKANGFWTSNEHWYRKRVRENGVFDVCVSLDYKEIEITKICGAGTDEEEADYGMNIELGDKKLFVHELQHVLRFYGLNKFADTFKVK